MSVVLLTDCPKPPLSSPCRIRMLTCRSASSMRQPRRPHHTGPKGRIDWQERKRILTHPQVQLVTLRLCCGVPGAREGGKGGLESDAWLPAHIIKKRDVDISRVVMQIQKTSRHGGSPDDSEAAGDQATHGGWGHLVLLPPNGCVDCCASVAQQVALAAHRMSPQLGMARETAAFDIAPKIGAVGESTRSGR